MQNYPHSLESATNLNFHFSCFPVIFGSLYPALSVVARDAGGTAGLKALLTGTLYADCWTNIIKKKETL
jgi:hypothetical protein